MINESKAAWITSAVALTSAAAGFVISAPIMIGTGVAGAAVAGTAALIDSRRKEKLIAKLREPLVACDICLSEIREGIQYITYPSVISRTDNYMMLHLPHGMSVSDIVKKQSILESYFGRTVLIAESENKKVIIKMLNPTTDEGDKWLSIFLKANIIKATGSHPKLAEIESNNIGKKLLFSLPPGLTIDDFESKHEELEDILKSKIEIRKQDYKLVIQTIAKDFKKSYTIDFRRKMKAGMEFIVGVGRGEEQLTVDLGGNEFSTLVCGASGSGKSVFLNCLMIQFILKNVEIRAIDLKAVEFAIFKRYENMSKYATNRKEAVQVLGDTYDLMQQRYKELEEKDCKSYSDYNNKFDDSMPPILLIIDEFSALMGDKAANYFLFELLSRARAANILVVICTQTPRAKILDGTIRCNIKNTICFSVETDTDSEVALGQKGNFRAARELMTVGRGFLKSKKELVEFQGYYLTDQQIKEQIASKIASRQQEEVEVIDNATSKVIPLKSENKEQIEQVVSAIDSL